jgi:hypothetical protein
MAIMLSGPNNAPRDGTVLAGVQLGDTVAPLSATPAAVTARLSKLFDGYLTNK